MSRALSQLKVQLVGRIGLKKIVSRVVDRFGLPGGLESSPVGADEPTDSFVQPARRIPWSSVSLIAP